MMSVEVPGHVYMAPSTVANSRNRRSFHPPVFQPEGISVLFSGWLGLFAMDVP
jgi:hypothetical protein